MSQVPEKSKSQEAGKMPVVSLLVGKEGFTMWRSTVDRYPDSLIAKLMKAHPIEGPRYQPLFIDRNPFTFEWIHEIYRGGDIEGTMPDRSTEFLQRELDFYQLPSLKELGLHKVKHQLSHGYGFPAKQLMSEIVAEIDEGGLEDLFPWYVYVYYRIRPDAYRPKRCVLVLPACLDDDGEDLDLSFIADRGHEDFFQALKGSTFSYAEDAPTRMHMVSHQSGTKFRVKLATDDFLGFMNRKAFHGDLHMEGRKPEYPSNDSYPETFRVFYLTY